MWTGGSATSKTISGLRVSIRYSIEVAAVGAGVVGVFSDPVIADESEQMKVGLCCRSSVAHFLVLLLCEISAPIPSCANWATTWAFDHTQWAVYRAGSRLFSLITIIPSLCDAPSAPGGVAVSEATGSSVRVTWTAAPPGNIELLEYRVSFQRLTGRGCDGQHSNTDSVNNMTTDYTVMGLSGLSTYKIGVVAATTFGLSMGVTSDTFDTLPTRESWVCLLLFHM